MYFELQCKRAIEIVKRILNETDEKVVIVSQWTTFLTIMAEFLHRQRVHYVELTGKTAIKDRNDIVVSFNKPNTPERVSICWPIHTFEFASIRPIFNLFKGHDAVIGCRWCWTEFGRCKSFDIT